MNIALEELYFIWNGGPGSGNPNPGQGRGRGKPAGGSGGDLRSWHESLYRCPGPVVANYKKSSDYEPGGRAYERLKDKRYKVWSDEIIKETRDWVRQQEIKESIYSKTITEERLKSLLEEAKTLPKYFSETALENMKKDGLYNAKLNAEEKEKRKSIQLERQTETQKAAVKSIQSKVGFEGPGDKSWFSKNVNEKVAVAIDKELTRMSKEYGIDLNYIKLQVMNTSLRQGQMHIREKKYSVGSDSDSYQRKNSYETIVRLSKTGLIFDEFTERKWKSYATVQAGEKEPWWTAGDAGSNFVHEMGHVAAMQKMRQLKIDPGYYTSFNNFIVTTAADNYEKKYGSGSSRKAKMSTYGRENSKESVAESVNNPNYSDYTKEIDSALKGATYEEFEKYMKNRTVGSQEYKYDEEEWKKREINKIEKPVGQNLCSGLPTNEVDAYFNYLEEKNNPEYKLYYEGEQW